MWKIWKTKYLQLSTIGFWLPKLLQITADKSNEDRTIWYSIHDLAIALTLQRTSKVSSSPLICNPWKSKYIQLSTIGFWLPKLLQITTDKSNEGRTIWYS